MTGIQFENYIESKLRSRSDISNLKKHPEILLNGACKHHFDFECSKNEETIVIECKHYDYTSEGNVPSGKISTLNEAVFFLEKLNPEIKKVLCLNKSAQADSSGRTLAERYVEKYSSLMEDILVYEVDTAARTAKRLR